MSSNFAQLPSSENSSKEASSQLPPSALVVVPPGEDATNADIGGSNPSVTGPLSNLPVQLDVCILLPSFRVQDLLALTKERVLESGWSSTEDLPLWCGDVQLVWSEFEVVDTKLAVRVTRLV